MRVPSRFNGPDGSANGGYASGAVACALAPPDGAGLAVSLRRPPPLEVELQLRDGALYDGDAVVAESAPAEPLTGEVPQVSVAEAAAAQERYFGFVSHAFPRCFTCGPERAVGDGLRIFPGSIGRDGVVATVWEPHPALSGADGVLDPVVVWEALDCPSGIAVIEPSGRPAVLGRLTAQLLQPVRTERRYVVLGWPREGAGRRSLPAASAILDEAGELVARAEAVWVSVDVPVHETGRPPQAT